MSEVNDLDIHFNHLEDRLLCEFHIDLDNVLVLTSKPSCDAISISLGTYLNEWFEINDGYDIPSSSQILGTLAKQYGIKGIMYTSVRQQFEHNLVIFEENVAKLDFKNLSSRNYRPTLEILTSS